MRAMSRWLGRWVAVVALVLLASGARAPEASADTYAFDRDHTNITFSWNHLGISRQSARILDFDGTLNFDPENPENASVDASDPDVAPIPRLEDRSATTYINRSIGAHFLHWVGETYGRDPFLDHLDELIACVRCAIPTLIDR